MGCSGSFGNRSICSVLYRGLQAKESALAAALDVRLGQLIGALSSVSELSKETVRLVNHKLPEIINIFSNKAWIKWIEQLLTLLVNEEMSLVPRANKALQALVETLSSEYPHVALPFLRVCYESRVFAKARDIFCEHQLSPSIQWLRKTVFEGKIPKIYHQCVIALEALSAPKIIWSDGFLTPMERLRQNPPLNAASAAYFLSRFLSIISFPSADICDKPSQHQIFPSWLSFFDMSQSPFGEHFDLFCSEISTLLGNLVTPDPLNKSVCGGLLKQAEVATLGELIRDKLIGDPKILDSLNKDFASRKVSSEQSTLTQLSPFLANFSPHPKQPLWAFQDPDNAESRLPVVAWSTQVQVLQSKQLPKKISFFSSDGCIFSLMVKAGDDLRIDRRVNAFIGQVKQELDRCGHRISLRNYSVFPTSTIFGAVEWCDGTTSYKSLLQDCVFGMKVQETAAFQIMKESMLSWFAKNQPNEQKAKKKRSQAVPVAVQWGQYCVLAEGELIARNLNRAVKALPQQNKALISLFISISPSVSQFLKSRHHFLSVLGASNAISYVLGVGDRHADNMLVETTTLTPINIDYGYALNFSVAALEVPELMPFRWTPLLQAMEPVSAVNALGDCLGYMTSALTLTLGCMRRKKTYFAQLLRLFVEAPLQDPAWLSEASRLCATATEISFSSDETMPESQQNTKKLRKVITEAGRKESFYNLQELSKTKIQTVNWKLEGLSPAVILVNDLRKNSRPAVKSNLGNCPMIRSLIDFPGRTNSRAGLSASLSKLSPEKLNARLVTQDVLLSECQRLDVETQSQLLAAMAARADIIGRAWIGWGAFL
eukprot:Gregarina_sp_Poly_1__7845@NODE_444_length_8342_cov_78_805438_g362_i0_p2_GENE_NODE_444_length_8342_cov_78_805438_g362_i0NODE_444_length_8342_cov_78_805438_g362_i0_p2_ORF_typecomplete_len828_score112_17PI3_PI4_kinase/PF00454_27/6_7e33PI3_PI4_kinase/PF00454_27/1e03FATC/PF02260_20/0_017Iron_traffic/PF04362_14/0_4DUF4135/PF13575_6/5_9e03DUF4135/PF13575_6/0_49_NODE_444_length_8342_cov_78_805438_g362_i028905373